MTEEIPVLDTNAEDREAEALRYADAVARWHASKQHPKSALPAPAPTDRPGVGRVFEWPCERRDAHHPHNAYLDSRPSEFCPVCGRERGQSHARSDCDGECPGVGAHPLTQIGGNYSEEEI